MFEREKQLAKETNARVSIFSELRAALEAHATIEEEIFYPAVKRARSENVKDEVREGYEEHKQIKSLLAQISSITPRRRNLQREDQSPQGGRGASRKGRGRQDVSRRQKVPE
jgi:hemerythrin superfamily protein